jgi:hypothetical protein
MESDFDDAGRDAMVGEYQDKFRLRKLAFRLHGQEVTDPCFLP